MTSAPITEIRAVLRRLLESEGVAMASVEFTMDASRCLKVTIAKMRTDGADRAAQHEVAEETPAERREGPLAYPRRVTVAMQELEDAVTSGPGGKRT